ncbi:hypothetical protein BA718_10915 [Streptococcus gallolyticus subsp. gallolyticus]|uniref:hypothetical protein n=1 Tax=Streptococcus gallolyticus TaxID=315405 RepID=UPI00081BC946|nr:hypothetical protein [Streptococcus gallolyticus]OCW49478.1 hypothetical protein BA718_10915 [Streptococcus gallolyticus subsp. gallolyticus]
MTKYFLYNDKQYVDKNVRSCYHEQSRAEQSRAEQSRAEQSRAEQSRADSLFVLFEYNCILKDSFFSVFSF